MARFRWSQDGADKPGKKIRPCLVVKAANDGGSVILVPISTKEAFQARDGIEIRPAERARAGLTPGLRSWAKLTEINRVDLPSSAIMPSAMPDGRLAWARGRVSDEILQQVQMEIGHRVSDKTLKGSHIKADDQRTPLALAGIRVVRRETSEADARLERVRAVAAKKAARQGDPSPLEASQAQKRPQPALAR